MKKVVFITTGQPTTNPRLVKEAETLSGQGYDVKVICCFYQHWAEPFDLEITARNPGMFIYCGGHPEKDKLTYYKTLARKKISNLLAKYFKVFGIPENAISRTHAEALKIAHKIKADFYIAHNLGALPAAVLAAKYNKAKVGYDAEDMHSGQFDSTTDNGYLLNKYIEEHYFTETDYFTAASPLIAANYRQVYPYLNPVTINNVFPKVSFAISQHTSFKLRLVWFSQTVGPERGIEDTIQALGLCSENIELHLVGNISIADRNLFTEMAGQLNLHKNQLQFHPPVSPDKLPQFIAGFDVGMATETASTLNRDICLTNKIFTYVQCGLALIASDTQAQSLFIKQHPQTGLLFQKGDVSELAKCISTYAKDPELLWKTRLQNHILGQTSMNWESESQLFLQQVAQII